MPHLVSSAAVGDSSEICSKPPKTAPRLPLFFRCSKHLFYGMKKIKKAHCDECHPTSLSLHLWLSLHSDKGLGTDERAPQKENHVCICSPCDSIRADSTIAMHNEDTTGPAQPHSLLLFLSPFQCLFVALQQSSVSVSDVFVSVRTHSFC